MMEENVIDVLMFLFDNYLSIEEGMPTDEIALATELEEAGFEAKNITKAFDWLGELADIKQAKPSLVQTKGKAMRVYLPQEQQKLDVGCLGFIHQLETMGLLDTSTREIIIDRAMAIESPQLGLKEFKRIVGLVLLNSGSHEEMLTWIEDLIYDDVDSVLH
jgi:Smg protein